MPGRGCQVSDSKLEGQGQGFDGRGRDGPVLEQGKGRDIPLVML